VSRLLGVRRRRFDRQVALVGWLETDGDDADATLTVESGADGWWYTCRVPGRRRVAAWVTAERPERQQWEERLRATRHLSRLLRAYRMSHRVVVRPADSSLLERTWGPGWVAIGDAAASYDPLASRGLVSALSSGLNAAVLVDATAAQLAEQHAALVDGFHGYLDARRQYYASERLGGLKLVPSPLPAPTLK
jgi:flavin-dependent dehydrogenase